MRLGKKLNSTNIKYRLSLLAEGLVFYTKNLEKIKFDEYCLYIDNHQVGSSTEHLLDVDWHYPAETYTINGVELVDERYIYGNDVEHVAYVSCPVMGDFYFESPHITESIKEYCNRNLVHTTKEAAILHTKAMMKVAE